MSTPMNLVFKNGTDYLFAYCRHDGNSNVENLKSASVSDLKFIYDEIMKYKDVPGIFITHISNNLAYDDEPDQGTIAFDTWGNMDDDECLIIAFRGDSSIINKSMDEIYDYIQNTTDYHPLDIGGYTFYADFDREKVAGTTDYKRSPRFIPMKQKKDAYRHYPSAHFDWRRDTGKGGLDKYTVPMDKSGILNTPDADSMHESHPCSMQKKKESLLKKNEDGSISNLKIKVKERKVQEYISADDAMEFVKAHSNGILRTIAEICAEASDGTIEDTYGKEHPDVLKLANGNAQFAYSEYAKSLEDLIVRIASKFAISRVENWGDDLANDGNL